MAITRTAWIDDDGSGTTGTIINNAVKTELYNQIDAALATLLPLAGGTLVGDLKFTDASFDIGKLGVTRPRDGFFSRDVVAGGKLTVAGQTFIGTTAALSGAFVTIRSSGALFNGVDLDETNNTSGAFYLIFSQSGTSIGTITRNAATSAVLYNTTSDKRLKRDRGVATDTAVLRQLVIHEFDWLDGTPDRGVFAQDAYLVSPRGITVGRDDVLPDGRLIHPWQTDYSKYVPDLIVGWQEHDRRLAALEAAREQ
jgi:hypothetical protein